MSKLDPLPDYLVKHVEDYKEIYNMDKAYGTPKSLGTPSPIQEILWDLIISDRLASVDNPEITEATAALLEYIQRTIESSSVKLRWDYLPDEYLDLVDKYELYRRFGIER